MDLNTVRITSQRLLLRAISADDAPELGIWLKKSAQGAGYGYETIQTLVIWAQENLTFTYLRYPVDKRNTASRKIPLKLQATAGREYKKLNLSGFELDEIEYWIYKKVPGNNNT
jgi:[ribosomal protein S5]-alanine N-acetyltransferase